MIPNWESHIATLPHGVVEGVADLESPSGQPRDSAAIPGKWGIMRGISSAQICSIARKQYSYVTSTIFRIDTGKPSPCWAICAVPLLYHGKETPLEQQATTSTLAPIEQSPNLDLKEASTSPFTHRRIITNLLTQLSFKLIPAINCRYIPKEPRSTTITSCDYSGIVVM